MSTDQFFTFFDSGWIEFEDKQKLFSRIDPIDNSLNVGEHVAVVSRKLPMHEDASLICLTSDKWEQDLRVCYLAYEDNLLRLDGTSPPIHRLNAEAGININEQNALYYLSYFCFFVRGEEGPFYLLYDLEDKLLPDGFFDLHSNNDSGVLTPRQLFRRPRLCGKDDEGNWRASALVHYGNALFHADLVIKPTGLPEMINDEPLIQEMALQLNAPLTASVQSV